MTDQTPERRLDIRDFFTKPQGALATRDLAPSVELIKIRPGSIKRPSMTYVQPSASSSGRSNESGWYEPEYPLVDIGAAEDTDSYVYQAIFKKLALAMKEGWNLTGMNSETVRYVKERFKQLAVAQDQTFKSLIIEMMGTLLRYHSVFLIKSRSIEKSGGRVRTSGKRKVKPVAAYFVVSPDTMQFKIGKDYRFKAFRHVMPDGRFKIFRPEDVVYIHINKKPHFMSPTPPWHPVIEDVQALRQIEEHVQNLIYQHIYPIYQYKVGTKELPMRRYQDGSTEVDFVKAKVRDMPSDGMIVTPERHEITGLGSESRALRAESYLEHFKKRVVTGTGMSQLDFGDGDTANRSTADSMSKLAVANVKFYQQQLADGINYHIIRELLLESAFKFDAFAEENLVELEFVEIDHEAQIKLQNHYMLLFQANVITLSEARKLSGWEAMTEEQKKDCALQVVSFTKMEKESELGLKSQAAKSASEGAIASAEGRQQPSNQHGVNTGPAKRKSSIVRDGVAAEIYGQLSRDINNISPREINLGLVRQLFFAAETQIKQGFRNEIDSAAMSGVRGFVLTGDLLQKIRSVSNRVFNDFESDVQRLFRQSMSRTGRELAVGQREDLSVDRLEFRIHFIEKTLTHKAYIMSKVAAMQANDITHAKVKAFPDGEDFHAWNDVVIELNSITPEDLPPFHPNCRCDLVLVGDQ
tara:strand:+ start:2309 stop:4396 length:2088 start_codon:yes stop_codon:yes gene_type:complete